MQLIFLMQGLKVTQAEPEKYLINFFGLNVLFYFQTGLSFGYDLESIIDDFILMSFLVGNDFIPHLPNLHIHSDALPFLWRTYIKVMPTLDGRWNQGVIYEGLVMGRTEFNYI